jgi:RNA polymerase sigma factor (TIGR02999 family)
MLDSRASVTELIARLCAEKRAGTSPSGRAWPSGGDGARDEVLGALFERVYDELRRGARGQRRRWTDAPSLRTTALAHEAYLKLVEQGKQSWTSRSHFFAVAAQAMRYLLINEARRRHAQKRGGGAPEVSLEELRTVLGREVATGEGRAEVLLVLDEALVGLEERYPRAARGVECRFFVGMTIEETAEALGISAATVSRDWTLAQAWLYRAVKQMMSAQQTPEGEGLKGRAGASDADAA